MVHSYESRNQGRNKSGKINTSHSGKIIILLARKRTLNQGEVVETR